MEPRTKASKISSKNAEARKRQASSLLSTTRPTATANTAPRPVLTARSALPSRANSVVDTVASPVRTLSTASTRPATPAFASVRSTLVKATKTPVASEPSTLSVVSEVPKVSFVGYYQLRSPKELTAYMSVLPMKDLLRPYNDSLRLQKIWLALQMELAVNSLENLREVMSKIDDLPHNFWTAEINPETSDLATLQAAWTSLINSLKTNQAQVDLDELGDLQERLGLGEPTYRELLGEYSHALLQSYHKKLATIYSLKNDKVGPETEVNNYLKKLIYETEDLAEGSWSPVKEAPLSLGNEWYYQAVEISSHDGMEQLKQHAKELALETKGLRSKAKMFEALLEHLRSQAVALGFNVDVKEEEVKSVVRSSSPPRSSPPRSSPPTTPSPPLSSLPLSPRSSISSSPTAFRSPSSTPPSPSSPRSPSMSLIRSLRAASQEDEESD